MATKKQQKKYWLFKSEPSTYSIDDFAKFKVDMWDGIRNYQVRNLIRDEIKKGDDFFFYHSSCDLTGIAGIGQVVKNAYPDPTQFDANERYYDPKSKPDDPRWLCVDVKFVAKAKNFYPLEQMRVEPKLEGLALLAKGNRLSIQTVSAKHWNFINKKLF